ncbi:histidine kinase [Capsulimonas corticalis]|uniref:histidine kinase n=1 Tax=Capsulimonas corticalis TaxID=2219043 RepID=A0A402D434_9BACT|nr:sensor histidine kinase [Capsulimonas corticalis]BDI29670.1 histidine kinase [Capsulimonas corticalis]
MRQNAFFRVDASLMQQLGASLITDDMSALIELIKNAYDADATNVKIIIESPDRIVVEDNGHGMNEKIIERGWLTLSNSLKLEQKNKGILTAKQKRTPLGDKGLGRLSTQRLGNRLRIETCPEDSDQRFAVEIDWSTFKAGSELGSIPVDFEVLDRSNKRPGTKLIITELSDPEHWTRLKTEDLKLSLASLVSPYSEVARFRLQAFLNGIEVSPSLLSSNIRKAAWQHLDFVFDGNTLESSGRIKSQSLRGTTKKAKEDYERYFQSDSGAGFLKFILSDKKSSSYRIVKSESKFYFIEFLVSREFLDIISGQNLSNPGNFSGEVDSFSLQSQGSADVMEENDIFNSASAARQLVKDLSGIRVYRDGFVIRTEHDWLKLGEGQTSGSSFYGLRPFNTMGYVALSAIHNSKLRETTDREGFIDDPYYRAFFQILRSFLKTSNDVIEHIRRTWTSYIKEQEMVRHELPSRDPKIIEDRLNDSFERVGDAKILLGQASKAILASVEEDAKSLFPNDPKTASRMNDVQELLAQASETLDTVSARGGLGGLLVAELNSLNTRISEVYELVSLGITAEVLSHDISVILERLSLETNNIQKHAQSSNLNDLKILRFFEVVRSTVSALEKQLGHLDPALKYAREKREGFLSSELITECESYYRQRLVKNNILLAVFINIDFSILMNKGKLIQILDNLVLNSEYWITKSFDDNKQAGQVIITVEKPCIIISDSGPGIEPAFEETLFDPFITAKPAGEGRGLGLFIATQLLELDGCSINLLAEKNNQGRRFRIAVNLEGVLLDA